MANVEGMPSGDEAVHLVAVDALESESSLFSRAWHLGRNAVDMVSSFPEQAWTARDTLRRHLNGSYDPEFLKEHFDPILVETQAGTHHEVRLLNREDMRESNTALVLTFPLGVRSDHGFLIDQIAELQAYCHEVGIGLATVSSEGFAKPVRPSKLRGLDFDMIAANVYDSIEGAQAIYNQTNWAKPIHLHSAIFTGASRGGTTSLKVANPEIPKDKGYDYEILGTIPIAPAGRSKLSPQDRLIVAHQFGFGETASELQKFRDASFTGKIKRFGQLAGTIPHWQAMPAIARTAAEYLHRAPLATIEHEVPEDTPVFILTYDRDKVTTPHIWPDLFANYAGRREIEEGSHLDLESDVAREFIKTGLDEILGRQATNAA